VGDGPQRDHQRQQSRLAANHLPGADHHQIRIYITGALNSSSRITEVEAYAAGSVSLPGTLAKSAPPNGSMNQSTAAP
jgi:hypothetical protein